MATNNVKVYNILIPSTPVLLWLSYLNLLFLCLTWSLLAPSLDDKSIGDAFRREISGASQQLRALNSTLKCSVAPGGQIPIPVITDHHFEELCNPRKFCFGNGGFYENHPNNITLRKYFNWIILDVDGRFARGIENQLINILQIPHANS